jgi:hypothetical protein
VLWKNIALGALVSPSQEQNGFQSFHNENLELNRALISSDGDATVAESGTSGDTVREGNEGSGISTRSGPSTGIGAGTATAIVPVREKEVNFYGDQRLVAQGDDEIVWVPLRPLCDHLGLNWSGARQRVNRDPVLSGAQGVCIIHTPGGDQQMLCLPLDLIPGWLFGVTVSKVRPEFQEKILRSCAPALPTRVLQGAMERFQSRDLAGTHGTEAGKPQRGCNGT